MFDAIVLSNGWDDATAVLQLLSHLEGDALNVALLVPVFRRASQVGLVDALTTHYGSPGRLADYRRQFEKTIWTAGEDPSIFAIALETLETPDQVEVFFRRLLASAATPALTPKPEPPAVDQLLQRLVAETQARQPAPAAATGSAGLETLLRNLLSGNLAAHCGSPGRLADYLRQFEKTTRTAGENPSIFAIALEILAVKTFRDMDQTARLRLTWDRFITGHNSCELRRHLDSVPQEAPIQDIVDRCRVWESHADSDVWRVSKPGPDPVFPTYVVSAPDRGVDDLRVAAVTTPQSTPDQVEVFFRQLLASAAAPAPTPKPEPPAVDQLLQRLVAETQDWRPAPAAATGSAGWKLCLGICFLGIWPQYDNLDRDPYDGIGMR